MKGVFQPLNCALANQLDDFQIRPVGSVGEADRFGQTALQLQLLPSPLDALSIPLPLVTKVLPDCSRAG